jgi:hypothetical protein
MMLSGWHPATSWSAKQAAKAIFQMPMKHPVNIAPWIFYADLRILAKGLLMRFGQVSEHSPAITSDLYGSIAGKIVRAFR